MSESCLEERLEFADAGGERANLLERLVTRRRSLWVVGVRVLEKELSGQSRVVNTLLERLAARRRRALRGLRRMSMFVTGKALT